MSSRAGKPAGRVAPSGQLLGEARKKRLSLQGTLPRSGSGRSIVYQDPSETVEKKPPRFICRPENSFRLKWDIFVSLLIVYSTVVVPFRICFEVELQPMEQILEYVLVDLVFLLDIFLTFRTAFYDDDEVLVTQWKPIAVRYLRTWFVVDTLSTLPIDGIVSAFVDNAARTDLNALKIVRILRLVRLIKLIRLLKLAKFSRSVVATLSLNPAMLRLLTLIVRIVYSAHFLACFWFYVSTFDPNTNLTWIFEHHLVNEPIMSQYIAAFYWTIATMMSIGYGDIYAVNDLERLYSIFVQLFGAMLFGFIIASVNSFLETYDPRASAYRSKMDSLKEYIRERSIPKGLGRRVRKYYDVVLSKSSIFDDVNILGQLPHNMTAKIIMQIHSDTARRLNFIKDENISFVSYVMARMQPLYAAPGEVVAEIGTAGTHVCFVVNGRVGGMVVEENEEFADESFLSERRGSSQVSERDLGHAQFEQNLFSLPNTTQNWVSARGFVQDHATLVCAYFNGSYYGDIAVFQNECHAMSYKALSKCDLLQVSKEDLEYAFYLCPGSAWTFQHLTEIHENCIEKSRQSKTHIVKEATETFQIKELVTINGLEHKTHFYTLSKLGLSSTADPVLQALQGKAQVIRIRRQLSSVRLKPTWFLLSSFTRKKPKKLEIEKIWPSEKGYLGNTEPSVSASETSVTLSGGMDKAKRLKSNVIVLRTGEKLEDADVTLSFVIHELRIIPPDHPRKAKWDVMMASLIIYSVMVVPFRISFGVPATGFFYVFDWIVDALFFMDIILTFRTAYHHPDEEILIVVPRMIARHYLRGWFAVDFLSTFPFDVLIDMVIVSPKSNLLELGRLLKILRLIRLLKLIRLFKLKALLRKTEDLIDLSPAVMKLATLLLQVSLVAHLFGCFFFLVSVQGVDLRDMWWFAEPLRFAVDSKEHLLSKYLAAIYWAFSTMTTVGYGDIAPKSDEERVYAIAIMIMGATVFGYVIGSTAKLISMFNLGEALHKAKMSELEEYMREQGIPKRLRSECKKCYAYSMSLTSVFDEDKILAQLSPSLRNEVLLYVHREAIPTIPLFCDQSISFISAVIRIMHPQLALQGSRIIHNGALGNQLYCVVKGHVEIIQYTFNASGKAIPTQNRKTMGKGDVFGHNALLSGKRHRIDAVARTITHMYVLTKAAIGKMVDKNPQLAVLLEEAITAAVRNQEIRMGAFHQTKAKANKPKEKKWSLVKSKFKDIVFMSPNQMTSSLHDADKKVSIALEAMMGAEEKALQARRVSEAAKKDILSFGMAEHLQELKLRARSSYKNVNNPRSPKSMPPTPGSRSRSKYGFKGVKDLELETDTL